MSVVALYLFGVIGMQGIALMQENKVDMFDPLTLAVGATIMVVGIGGNIGFEGGFLSGSAGSVHRPEVRRLLASS